MSDDFLPYVLRSQQGDAEAISWLVERMQDRVFRFCFHLCGEKGMAEDLCQETLVKSFKQIARLKEPDRFVSWVLSIARNHFLDEVRRPGHTHEVLERRDEDTPPSEAPADDHFPQDSSLEVREALQKLKPEDRLLLILVDIEENSYLEAAEIIGISESAVRSRLHRARSAFLKIFNGE